MVLVTGASGLLGLFLIKTLLEKGEKVRAFCRIGSELELIQLYENKIEIFEGDILDFLSLEKAMEGVKKVYHLAALISFVPKHRQEMYRVNVEGTQNVVDLCLRNTGTKLCHVSSISVLESYFVGKVDESDLKFVSELASSYGITKYNAELEVWRGVSEGLQAIIVNPSFILGPGSWKRQGSSSIFQLMWKKNKFYPVGSTGFVDVRDVANCMIKLMEMEVFGQRYIISGENETHRSVLNKIAHGFDVAEPKFKASPILGAFLWRADKLRSLFSNSLPLLTKESVRTASRNRAYTNKKITQQTGHQFYSLDETIRWCCAVYLEKMKGAS